MRDDRPEPRTETRHEFPSSEPLSVFPSEKDQHEDSFLLGVRETAERGDPAAQYRLGLALFQEHRESGDREVLEEALRWLNEAANQGHARAQFALGAMYEEGRGVIQDYVEAAKWFRKAADQAESDALYRLGRMSEEGKGGPKDMVEAYVWFNLAAARGETRAELARDRARALISEKEVAEAQERARVLDQAMSESKKTDTDRSGAADQ